MTKILYLSDVHIADQPPLGRKPGYREQILAKLEEIGGIARNEKVDAVIINGDLFHRKRPNFNSYHQLQCLQEELEGWGTDIYINPGNHDLGTEGLDSLNDQPLGALRSSHNIFVIEEAFHVGLRYRTIGDVVLYFLPYSEERDVDPSYYSMPPDAGMPEGKPVILVAHGSIVPPGEKRPYLHLPVDQIHLTGVNLFLSSHIHEDMGLRRIPDSSTLFCNPGSVGRPSRRHLERQPKVLTIEFLSDGPPEFTEHILKSVLPAEEVFLAQEGNGKADDDAIAAFAQAVEGTAGLLMERAPIEEILAGIEGSPEMKKLVQHYLEEGGL